MRQSLWKEAYDAFFHAFRAFYEAGDPRRIACLKYLVLATMMSESKINPLDTNEARSYQTDPDIVPMTELIDACNRNDIKKFERVLKDKQYRKSITEDSFLYGYLEPLIRRVRCQVVLAKCKPYRTKRLSYLAQELAVTVEEVEALCVSLILDGKLDAGIDQSSGLLILRGGGSTSAPIDETRFKGLIEWCDKCEQLSDGIVARVGAL